MDALKQEFVLSGKHGRDGIEQAIEVLSNVSAQSCIVIRTDCEYLVKSYPFWRRAVSDGFVRHGGSSEGFPDADLWEKLDACCHQYQSVSFLPATSLSKPVFVKKKRSSSYIERRESNKNNIAIEWREAKERLPFLLDDDGVRLYCDGSYSGKSGCGGWGAVLVGKSTTLQLGGHFLYDNSLSGSEYSELLGAICPLEFLPDRLTATVYSDCLSLIKRASQGRFQQTGFHSAAWKRLQHVCDRHTIEWKWIRGHNGNRYNELADRIARQQRLRLERSRCAVQQ